jgi:nicotinate dehydrogenase large molybdopterin subunit
MLSWPLGAIAQRSNLRWRRLMPELIIEAVVNGRRVSRTAQPHQRLLDFLREDLHLTGTKEGCGAGECGSCSVFVDGVLMKSCLVPVGKVKNAEIQTVEGLATRGDLTVLQRAFHKTGASQCGYCIPGMVMAATAALRKNPFAATDEIRERLGGNICRCTGYQKIVEAVELARDVLNGHLPNGALEEQIPADGHFIGASVRRLDAPSKVSGSLRYAGDMTMPDMLHVQVLRSPHAHARIIRIDTSAASGIPGVEGVVTSADVPGKNSFGVFVHDQPILAAGRIRYVGEAVAAVAATDMLTAKRALASIRVEYELLPALFDPEEAMLPGAPVLHDSAPGNIVKHIPIRKGDVDYAFSRSDLIEEQIYTTQQVEHAYLEPEAGLAYVDPDGVVTVWSPSQNITHHRHMLAKVLAMPINKVRMIMSPVGGGFGGKEDMIYQGMLALLALKTRRPVRLVFTREESIATTAKRHPSRTFYRMGLMRSGHIVASEIRIIYDGGAYAMSTEGVVRKGAILAGGPYNIPNIKIDTYGVYTNNTPSGAFRSFGSLQSQFATESHLDICAEKLGLDPFEIRRINALRDGGTTHTKQILGSVAMTSVLDAAAAAAGWEPGSPSSRGGTRRDLGSVGVRNPCSPGARFLSETDSSQHREVA